MVSDRVDNNSDLKKRKKFDLTSIGLPAASAASTKSDEVMPRLASGIWPIALVQYQYGLYFPPDWRCSEKTVVHEMIMVRCRKEYGRGRRPYFFPEHAGSRTGPSKKHASCTYRGRDGSDRDIVSARVDEFSMLSFGTNWNRLGFWSCPAGIP